MPSTVRLAVLACSCVLVSLFSATGASAQSASALLDEIRRELPPELTIPENRTVTGAFDVPVQSVYGSGATPTLSGSVSAQLPTRNVRVGKITRLCKILGGCLEIDIENSEPGVDIDIVKYFGVEIEAGISGAARVGYTATLFQVGNPETGIDLTGTVPMKVSIELPAYNTVAPGQPFYVDSSWRIDESTQQFTFNTSEPDYWNLDTTLDFDLDFSLAATVCVIGCLDIDITITLPHINFNLFKIELFQPPFFQFRELEFCTLFDNTRLDGFCPLNLDLNYCDLFFPGVPLVQCPYFSLDDDPYYHYPIKGLEEIAPGSATIDVLKDFKDDELFYATTARNKPLESRKFISSDFNYAIAGMTLDLANAAASLLQLPPLNGSATDLFAWKGKSLNPVAKVAADLFGYNIFDASLGFDFVLGHEFTMTARAPMIRLQYTDPGGQYSIDESFRAGGRKLITMPDDLDPGELTISVNGRAPRFTTQVAGLIDPRFELSAAGASLNVPGVGAVQLNPIFATGDLLPPPQPFTEFQFDALVSGSFPTPPVYDLAPITRPNVVTGTVLNQPDSSTNIPRLVTNCSEGVCDEINFAIVDLTTGSNDEILVAPAGLITRNTQFKGGTFNLYLNQNSVNIKTDNGQNEQIVDGTYMVLGGNSLMPGLDSTIVNLALSAGVNSPGTTGEVQGGLEFASNDGAYIRNATINLAPFDDGTMLIVDDNSSGASFDILPPALVNPELTIKGRLAVYSGNNTNTSTTETQVIDLDIFNSTIRAVELVLSNSHVNNPKPIIVVLKDSTLHSNLDIRAQDSRLRATGNSLVAGRDVDFSSNFGTVDIRGEQTDVANGNAILFAVPLSSSVFDAGLELDNAGTIDVLPGGVLSVRSGSILDSRSGTIQLDGSYDDLGSMQAITVLSGLAPGYTADDLFAEFTANPINDALLIIDGGTVNGATGSETIFSRGATILGRAGSLNTARIVSSDARMIVDGGAFEFTESQLTGSGLLDVRAGGILSLTSGAQVNGLNVPLVTGQGLLTSTVTDEFARRSLDVENAGVIQLIGTNAVEFSGDVETNGHLVVRNGGAILVGTSQTLQFRGDAKIENRDRLFVEAGGTLSLLDQVPTLGEPIGPTYTQYDGLTTIDGTVSFGTNGVAENNNLGILGGSIEGIGSIDGTIENVGGTVAPGNAVNPNGTLSTNAYIQSAAGSLEVSINALGNSLLDVSGPVSLSGDLVVVMDADWWNASPPAVGDAFVVINHLGSEGAFENLRIRLSDGSDLTDYTFDIFYNPNTVSMVFREVDDEREVAEGMYGEISRFQDVSDVSFAFSFIEKLGASGITGGCGGGNFCPTGLVSRAQMAVFIERGMRGSDFIPPPATGAVFTDVAADSFAANFIEQLAADGITSGCGNSNYCPSAIVTRDQMAVFLLRAKYGAAYSPPPASGEQFTDVNSDFWAVAWIEQLAAEGISSGCGNGKYCPGAPVTRAQMAVFLVRTFGL